MTIYPTGEIKILKSGEEGRRWGWNLRDLAKDNRAEPSESKLGIWLEILGGHRQKQGWHLISGGEKTPGKWVLEMDS